ncbi:MAG TPA: hypothetical protein VJ869_09240 [Sphaerochaeta sp.]|nr:hypothetical protein [Sphaerochaeta sp.]
MKRRIIPIALILMVLVLVPVASAPWRTTTSSQSQFALGLNLGTNTGLGFQYRANRDFDVVGNLGLNNFGVSHLSFDIAANYKINEFWIDSADFDVTMGLGVNVGIPLSDGHGVNFSVLVPFGVVYHFESVPIDIYVRIAPGLRILNEGAVDINVGFSGFVGALWRFN